MFKITSISVYKSSLPKTITDGRNPFLRLTRYMRRNGLLRDTIHVSVDKRVAMFYYIVVHNVKNSHWAIIYLGSQQIL